MSVKNTSRVITNSHTLRSRHLNREVIIDCYIPADKATDPSGLHLLLVNDGQDLRTMSFEKILDEMYADELIEPPFCVGIHCSTDRKNEYGTALYLDYKGRGPRPRSIPDLSWRNCFLYPERIQHPLFSAKNHLRDFPGRIECTRYCME